MYATTDTCTMHAVNKNITQTQFIYRHHVSSIDRQGSSHRDYGYPLSISVIFFCPAVHLIRTKKSETKFLNKKRKKEKSSFQQHQQLIT